MPVRQSPKKNASNKILTELARINARLDVMTRLYDTIRRQKLGARTIKEENQTLAQIVTVGAERSDTALRAAKIIRQSKHRVPPAAVFISFRQPSVAEKKHAIALTARAKTALQKARE